MSVLRDQRATMSRDVAVRSRAEAERAAKDALVDTVRYLRDGLAAGWTWQRIATPLGVGPTAMRSYWKRNRMMADRIPDA